MSKECPKCKAILRSVKAGWYTCNFCNFHLKNSKHCDVEKIEITEVYTRDKELLGLVQYAHPYKNVWHDNPAYKPIDFYPSLDEILNGKIK